MNPHRREAARHVAEAIDSLNVAMYLLMSPNCRQHEHAKALMLERKELEAIRDKLIEAKEESA